ncbi:MAG: TIGR03905 family TSCPD domain-containing protein [Clostridia bacterium]|nr:TIGR03905 family TSCPD domain-containing protein [Clostridia bacterium]
MEHVFYPKGVCSMEIHFELDGNVVKNLYFIGGCNGNLKAISKLVEGQTVEYVEQKLLGNVCGRRTTSCADQLAIGLRKALNGEI